jgi:putative transposase
LGNAANAKKCQGQLATKTARPMITLSHYRFKQTTLKHQASSWRKVLVDVTAEYTYKTCYKCDRVNPKLGSHKPLVAPDNSHTIGKYLNCPLNILLKALRNDSTSGEISCFHIVPYTVNSSDLDLPG